MKLTCVCSEFPHHSNSEGIPVLKRVPWPKPRIEPVNGHAVKNHESMRIVRQPEIVAPARAISTLPLGSGRIKIPTCLSPRGGC